MDDATVSRPALGVDDDNDVSMADDSTDDEFSVLSWRRELSILYLGSLDERLEFLRERSAVSVSPFGVHAVFDLLLGREVPEPLANALVVFVENLARHHRAVYTSMAKSFMDFPWRLLGVIQDLALVNPRLALRGVPLLTCLDKFKHTWVSRPLGEDEAWNLFNLPFAPSTDLSLQDRMNAMKNVLKFLLKTVDDMGACERLTSNLLAFVHSLLLDEDNEDNEFKDTVVLEVFGDPVVDAPRASGIPRFALGALLGRLVRKDRAGLHPQVVELVSSYVESDLVWALLTELSLDSLDWLAPLLSAKAVADIDGSQDGLHIEDVALDLLAAGLAGDAVDRDPRVRGTMQNALWVLSNLAVEDVYKPVFIQDRPMRIFIACWPFPSFHDTVSNIFRGLFSPDEATTGVLTRVGWQDAYRHSADILDVLDV